MPKVRIDQTLYRNMIGSLFYLTTSKPDVCFSIGLFAHYQVDPKQSHLENVKRIIMYISGSSNYGLYFTTYEANGYTDAGWVGNHDGRNST